MEEQRYGSIALYDLFCRLVSIFYQSYRVFSFEWHHEIARCHQSGRLAIERDTCPLRGRSDLDHEILLCRDFLWRKDTIAYGRYRDSSLVAGFRRQALQPENEIMEPAEEAPNRVADRQHR